MLESITIIVTGCRLRGHLVVTLSLLCALIGCGGGNPSAPVQQPAQNPPPSISALNPSAIAAGMDAFVLTINGSNFLASSQVQLNGTLRTAEFASSGQLTVKVEAMDISAAGQLGISVTNPTPGGGSATANLTVSAPAAPMVSSLTPSTITVGTAGATLEISGNNFVRNSVVRWNGADHMTAYIDNTHLSTAVSAEDLASGGYVQVTVFTAAPGGGTSNTQTVTVQYPLPNVSSLSPAFVQVGAPAFVLDVTGANFAPGALVYWNGVSRVTTFVSGTELRASILTTDLTQAEAAQITVLNPDPTLGQSQPVSFEVRNPVPVAGSVSPNTAFAGSSKLALTVTGTNFITGGRIQVAGVAQDTTFVSASTLIAPSVSLPSKSQANSVTVVNQGPGAPTSNAVVLTTVPSGPGVNSLDVGFTPSGTPEMNSTGRFVWDYETLAATCLGVSGCTPTITPFLSPLEDLLQLADITSDGRYVVVFHRADLAVPQFQLILRDRSVPCTTPPTGCADTSVATAFDGRYLGMSSDGRYVLYAYSQDPNGSDSSWHFVLADTCVQGPPGCVARVVVDESKFGPALSMTRDARYVLSATQTFNGCSSSPPGCVAAGTQVYDTCINAEPGCAPTAFVLPANNGPPVLSPDGRFVALGMTLADGSHSTFVYDTCAGVASCTPSQTPVVTGNLTLAGISRGGRYVTFVSSDSDLVPNDSNNSADVFRRDTCLSADSTCTPTTVRVSVTSSGEQYSAGSAGGAISEDGRLVLFVDTTSGGHARVAQLQP